MAISLETEWMKLSIYLFSIKIYPTYIEHWACAFVCKTPEPIEMFLNTTTTTKKHFNGGKEWIL